MRPNISCWAVEDALFANLIANIAVHLLALIRLFHVQIHQGGTAQTFQIRLLLDGLLLLSPSKPSLLILVFVLTLLFILDIE